MKTTWKDIVEDFLEIGCQLAATERQCIIGIFENASISSPHIEVHPAFSFNGHLVIIFKEEDMKSCWVYFKNKKTLQRGYFEGLKRGLKKDGPFQLSNG